jgi:hypothetical protein
MSNMCLRVGDPDGAQEEHKWFILVQAKECPMSSEEGETCIILHRSACGRGYKWAREGVFLGLKMRVECVCDSARALARSRRVACLCVAFFFRTVPTCSFYSLNEVHGYMVLVRGVILVGERALRPREGLIWWGHDLHCRGMALVLLEPWLHGQACAPLLEEWSSSLGTIGTCFDGRSFIAMKRRIMFITMATCLSLQL